MKSKNASQPTSGDQPKRKLTLKQERFCQLYARGNETYGHGTLSYLAVFGSKKTGYRTAQVNSSRLLSNAMISDRINELLESDGLNDQFVDSQLMLLLRQNEDKGSKLGAIREYNKVKGRITEKIDHTSKGEKIAPILSRTAKDEE